MPNLLKSAIAAPVAAGLSPILQVGRASPEMLLVQASFIYGSGGTTADFWLQTTADGGATWIDISQFRFLTTTARVLYSIIANQSIVAPYAATDGTLAANTSINGILGYKYRVKFTTTGTYAGTSISIDLTSQGQLLT